jgi:hypothetical protein
MVYLPIIPKILAADKILRRRCQSSRGMVASVCCCNYKFPFSGSRRTLPHRIFASTQFDSSFFRIFEAVIEQYNQFRFKDLGRLCRICSLWGRGTRAISLLETGAMSEMVGWDRGADGASNDADVSSILPGRPPLARQRGRLDRAAGWP